MPLIAWLGCRLCAAEVRHTGRHSCQGTAAGQVQIWMIPARCGLSCPACHTTQPSNSSAGALSLRAGVHDVPHELSSSARQLATVLNAVTVVQGGWRGLMT